MLRAAITAMAVLFAIPATLFALPAAADVTYDEATRSLKIYGPTSQFQSIMVHRAFANHEIDTIYMQGPGGELYAGLEIGRQIRKSGARVIIPARADCVSACAFAAMAAEEIHIDGRMLLHRPYMNAIPTIHSIEEVAAKFGIGYLDTTQYLIDMGYKAHLFKQMLRETSFCKFILVEDAKYIRKAKLHGSISSYQTVDKCGA
jgi:hypothetical protein